MTSDCDRDFAEFMAFHDKAKGRDDTIPEMIFNLSGFKISTLKRYKAALDSHMIRDNLTEEIIEDLIIMRMIVDDAIIKAYEFHIISCVEKGIIQNTD